MASGLIPDRVWNSDMLCSYTYKTTPSLSVPQSSPTPVLHPEELHLSDAQSAPLILAWTQTAALSAIPGNDIRTTDIPNSYLTSTPSLETHKAVGQGIVSLTASCPFLVRFTVKTDSYPGAFPPSKPWTGTFTSL